MKRVVVTGIGMIGPAGPSISDNWEAAKSGKTCIKPLSEKEGYPPNSLAAMVDSQWLEESISLRIRARADKFSLLGLHAALSATKDAGLEQTMLTEASVIMGCSVGGMPVLEEQYKCIFNRTSVHPMTIPKFMPSAASSQISMFFGCNNSSYTISAACASSNHAIGQAFHLIQNGHTNITLAGGAEAVVSPGSCEAWQALRVTATDTCRPFSKGRTGMALGEGGAVLILESLEHAEARGASIYCEIIGYGSSSDASSITAPDVDGMELAMHRALTEAKLEPKAINYVNAHGTGTLLNDTAEVSAIKRVFDGVSPFPPLSSTKAVFGHALGAASALEAVIVCKAIIEEIAPPTANFEMIDPQCNIDVIPNKRRKLNIEVAMSNAFAFGGINTSLIFSKYHGLNNRSYL